MPITATDVLVKYSNSSASAGNTTAGTVATSLGGHISTTAIPDATVGNLFPGVTGAENAADNVDYSCIFVHNNHPTSTLLNPRVWVAADVAGGAVVALAVDITAVSDITASSSQAVTIANKNTAPAGVGPFTEPLTAAEALLLSDIGPGKCRAFWIRRTATNSGAMNADGLTIRIDADTAA